MLIEEYETIKSFAFLPERGLEVYRKMSGDEKSTMYELRQILDQEFKQAASEKEQLKIILKNGNTKVEKMALADRVYIITSIPAWQDGSPIVLLFVPNRNPDKQPWELQGAISENEFNSDIYVEIGNKPQKMLFHYAQWTKYLEDLKILKNQLALSENWSFKQKPEDDDFPILKNYINYTFAKAWRDKQIFLSIDGRYSVFNTGLVNRNYQYIYIVFERNTGGKPWKFLMYSIPGVKHGGHLLAEHFKVLPKPVRYFSDISDISYILSDEKTPDEQIPDLQPDHYFIDHPERLPHYFLIDGCRKNIEIVSLLKQDISGFTEKERRDYWQIIGEKIASDPDVYDDLEAAFRNAVRKAVMRVSWNYRTAIPVYFPTNNKMSILLPISFNTKIEAEIALVVEYNSTSQKYSAPTILTLPAAYSNARLVCKPESDWLNQNIFERQEKVEAVFGEIENVEMLPY